MHYHLIIIVFILSVKSSVAQNIDLNILKPINSGEYATWDKTMKLTSHGVYPFMGGSAAALLITGYAKKDSLMIRNGYKTVFALGTSILLTEGIKISVKRNRPFKKYPDDITARAHASGYSFTSGHTSAAFCTATALSLSTKKWYVAIPAYTYAGLIGYSRMRLGVHYPSDVLGGMIIGIGTSLLTWQADKWINKK